MSSFTPPNKTWYKNLEFWMHLLNEYMASYVCIPRDSAHHNEIKAFNQYSNIKIVFESNLIESAGLSEGETEKLIKDNFPYFPDRYEIFKQLSEEDLDNTFQKAADVYGEELADIEPCISFGKKSKGTLEVLNHYVAIQKAQILALDYLLARSFYKSYITQKKTEELKKQWKSLCGDKAFPESQPSLFTEENIKELHETIGCNIMPEDSKVPAGQYRTDNRTIGLDVHLPSPELVPRMMEVFIDNTNKTLQSDSHPVYKTSKISYDFVRIHPFPDFNGRVSRIILSTILRTYSIPFSVSLRGNARERTKYLTALKKANNDYYEPYQVLIAINIVEDFAAIDKHLDMAGLPPIRSFRPQ